jgi:hypothetical protein
MLFFHHHQQTLRPSKAPDYFLSLTEKARYFIENEVMKQPNTLFYRITFHHSAPDFLCIENGIARLGRDL